MKWLWRVLRNGIVLIVKNPLIPFLVIVLIIYNQVFGGSSALASGHIDWTHASSIWNFLWKTIFLVLTPTWFLVGLLSVIGTTIVTIFEVEANFAIFAEKSSPLTKGLKAVLTWRAFQYFIFQIIVSALFILVFLGLVYTIVFPLGLSGIIGSILIFILVLLGYPTFYMTLATGAVICDAHVTLYEKRLLAETALSKNNFSKLFVFYFLRVGVETAVLSIALVVASYVKFSSFLELVIIVLIAVAPFAIIRTGGYMLKFEIFKDNVWFKEYFKPIYSNETES